VEVPTPGIRSLISPTASLSKRDLASLVLTQVMVLLMVRLCTQDLNQLLLWLNDTDTARYWGMYDNKREPFNPNSIVLYDLTHLVLKLNLS
jgi:hypothetical protein